MLTLPVHSVSGILFRVMGWLKILPMGETIGGDEIPGIWNVFTRLLCAGQ
jgi:hypothetical protein